MGTEEPQQRPALGPPHTLGAPGPRGRVCCCPRGGSRPRSGAQVAQRAPAQKPVGPARPAATQHSLTQRPRPAELHGATASAERQWVQPSHKRIPLEGLLAASAHFRWGPVMPLWTPTRKVSTKKDSQRLTGSSSRAESSAVADRGPASPAHTAFQEKDRVNLEAPALWASPYEDLPGIFGS